MVGRNSFFFSCRLRRRGADGKRSRPPPSERRPPLSVRVSSVAGLATTVRAAKIRDGGFLFELAQRENAQRGDARRAEDEDNVYRRVRFAERNSGDEIEKEDEKHDRRKRRRSDAKEFGHDAVPKGLASSVGFQGRRRDARPRADEISPDRAANDAPRSGAPRTRDASFF